METTSRPELYRRFLEFVRVESQKERNVLNRKMLSVFFWCFFLPALVSITVLVLVKIHVFPRSARGYLDWIVLVFPVLYSVYFLGSEVLVEVPVAFRRGSMSMVVGQAMREGDWRERVCEDLRKVVHAEPKEWNWISDNFRMDLESMKYRTRYLTALAGAVFFLIMQGIDSIGDTSQHQTWVRDPILGGWFEASTSDLSQFVGLALFLILLYLSGSHTAESLRKYLNVAELLGHDQHGNKS